MGDAIQQLTAAIQQLLANQNAAPAANAHALPTLPTIDCFEPSDDRSISDWLERFNFALDCAAPQLADEAKARRDNLADVAAKDGSQETLVNVLSLLFSLVLLPQVEGRPFTIWALFLLFTAVHLFANYRAVKCIQLETLNPNRLKKNLGTLISPPVFLYSYICIICSFVTSFGKQRSVRVAMKKNRRWICFDVWMDIFPHFNRPQLGLKLALLSPRFEVLVDAHFNGKTELTIWRTIRIGKQFSHCWICTDVWMDILPNFNRPQLGLKMALLSPRFDILVDKHFNGKNELTLWRTIMICKEIGTYVPKLRLFIGPNFLQSLPYRPLPNKIRFKDLRIVYIDQSVITFLRANQQIFDKGTNLSLYMPSAHYANNVQPIWDIFAREIWPIFAPNIRHLSISNGYYLDNLRLHASSSFLSNFDIISIRSDNLLPDVIGYDGPNAYSAGQALAKWLHIPTKNGQPKQLICCGDASETTELVNNFKEEFLRAITTSSASYIIRLVLFDESTEIGQFELTNERTNEKLTFEKEEKDDENVDEYDEDDDEEYTNCDWLLKRCQIGKTIQWEDKKTDNLNNVNISLCRFGPLSPPKAEQKNAKSLLEMNPGPSGQQKK
ncbi:hypothetical protein niasHT_010748 [Heterodera trifolii]|uniref:Protein root UVB sensitive/RUS domain-containing protein n=1 Tax=Heterodera trifolii TaxID=157864 RepID=A0ABD2LDU5_9BILA